MLTDVHQPSAMKLVTLLLLVGIVMASAAPAAAPATDSCSPEAVDSCYDPALSRTLHIAAFFIILVCSVLGVYLPYVAGDLATLSMVCLTSAQLVVAHVHLCIREPPCLYRSQGRAPLM